jgi:glycosyltransferase involved in cell wall biosynthesis
MRALVVTHLHPKFSMGGAQLSAWNIYTSLKRAGQDVHFLAFSPPKHHRSEGSRLLRLDPTDHVIEVGDYDYFWNILKDFSAIEMAADFVHRLAPDVVHLHHFLHIGWNGIRRIASVNKNVKLILTFHEYLLMCNNHGQMITTKSQTLCLRADSGSCTRCFPAVPELHFLKRQVAALDSLSCVHLVTAPSHFLMSRLIEFGVPEHKCVVIENLLDSTIVSGAFGPPRNDASTNPANKVRVGFFGRLTENKGIYVFISAAECILKSALCDSLEFHVWGDMSGQPRDEQDRIETALKSTAQNLTYHGPYDNAETTKLMSGVDYVVVPSVWWENAPLVIQEAFLSGRPVIASNIGGMREKVQDGENGLHFEVGNSRDLAKKLELAITPTVRETLRCGALVARARAVTTLDYVRLYEELASMQPRKTGEARRREKRPASVEVSG